jgi:hypothetical protein
VVSRIQQFTKGRSIWPKPKYSANVAAFLSFLKNCTRVPQECFKNSTRVPQEFNEKSSRIHQEFQKRFLKEDEEATGFTYWNTIRVRLTTLQTST